MPSLIDFRRRIRSVKNTEQITKAMKMVSAAKLRRAQERVIAARPYANLMREMLADIAAAAQSDERALESPWLARREMKRVDLIFFSSDTGLAGAFNSNLLKASQKFFQDHAGAEISLTLVGRKGRDFYRRRNGRILAEHINIAAPPHVSGRGRHREGSDSPLPRWRNRRGLRPQQRIQERDVAEALGDAVAAGRALEGDNKEIKDYIYEQSPVEMLDRLMPRYVEVAVFRAMLETVASYQAARMTAMDKASSNAQDVIDSLTLNMNRVRQAAITKEIIEVVSGAAAAEE